MNEITWEAFQQVELTIGTIVSAEPLPNARRPAYILRVDFGDKLGIKKSSAQITDLYQAESLVGKQVVAVTNFPPKQIGNIMSECLVTGFHRENGDVVLAVPEREVSNGTRLA